MGNKGEKRSAKIAKIKKARSNRQASKLRNRSKPLEALYGVMDGAPDDQLKDGREDHWHSLAVPLVKDLRVLAMFCHELTVAGGPGFQLTKWNAARGKKRRAAYHRRFMEAFRKANAAVPGIVFYVHSAQEHEIHDLAKAYIAMKKDFYLQRFPIRSYQTPSGITRVKVGPYRYSKRGQPTIIDDDLPWNRAAFIVWTAVATWHLYKTASDPRKKKPHWELLCDQFPLDRNGSSIGMLLGILAEVIGPNAITIKVDTENDSPLELLADCVASWVQICVTGGSDNNYYKEHFETIVNDPSYPGNFIFVGPPLREDIQKEMGRPDFVETPHEKEAFE